MIIIKKRKLFISLCFFFYVFICCILVSYSSSIVNKLVVLNYKNNEQVLYSFYFNKEIELKYNYYYMFNSNSYKLKLVFIFNNLNILNDLKKLFFYSKNNNLIKLIYFKIIKHNKFYKFIMFFDLNFNFKINYVVLNNYFKAKCLNISLKNKYNLKKKILEEKRKIIIAIDPGHGGVDPGAIGFKGIKEKNVVLSIAKKLLKIININKKYHAFLIREKDDYISFKKRFYIANKKNSDLIISIHTDSVLNRNVYGASVWISNYKLNLKCINKIIKIYDKYFDFKKDFFLDKEILDINKNCSNYLFNISSYISYNIALNIINKFKNIISLHKFIPQYGDLIILSSFNIPSILIETGYISNIFEEKKLNNQFYQNKIAKYIYFGINDFLNKYGLFLTKK